MFYRLLSIGLFGLTIGIGFSAHALDSDREQPATLNADDFEIDLATGVRIYRGNVIFRQGSILLECDELITHLNDDGGLDKGVCIGSPGRFRQRPEGAQEDVIGTARKITMDEISEEVVLKSRAKVSQGATEISGSLITYDLVKEKVKVKGGSQTASSAKKGDSSSTDQSAETDNARPSLVIQPRKKKKE